MSYSVILVEDEMLVLEDLASTTEWNRLGLNLIATATNGLESEDKIKTLEPDIVITDIRLPGQDGLEMLSHCPVSHAIILSGYTNFSYMQSAIRLGVFDYLQKPLDSEEFEATLLKLVDKIKEEDLELINFRKQNEKNSNGLINLPQSVENHVVNSAIIYISNNYSHPIGLQEASIALNISESHLSRLFKEVTGLNFLSYLNAWRVNKSIEMMKDTRQIISEVAINCGFPTPGYYAKIFRRFIGLTPTQYRDENISKDYI